MVEITRKFAVRSFISAILTFLIAVATVVVAVARNVTSEAKLDVFKNAVDENKLK